MAVSSRSWSCVSGALTPPSASLIYGAVGAGTSTALAALALAVAGARSPDRHHVFVLDLGAGDLAQLAGLPHTGAYIGAAERERQVRLIGMLRRELDARKAGGAQVGWFVLIDDRGALLSDCARRNLKPPPDDRGSRFP
jgi:S-DNA-T family DNA segregation ATPase FtsK/SpoIIIE